MDEDTVENVTALLEILESKIEASELLLIEISWLARKIKKLTEDARLGRLAVESEKDELLSVEDTAKFLKSFGE